MITCETITAHAEEFVAGTALNVIHPDIALDGSVVGLRLFDQPIVGFGSTQDELFDEMKSPAANVVLQPEDWLENAATIISFFLPFTDEVKNGNSRDLSYPSLEWMHARIDGQKVLNALAAATVALLKEHGHDAVAPGMEPEFLANYDIFSSNWSERHIAFVCGLGTFGLSKGLITKKGVAGRFVSVLTTLSLPPTPREYRDIYEYCNHCGVCVRNCPVRAITMDNGKAHPPCSDFLDEVFAKHDPYYGCGKCQIRVPCANGVPGKMATEPAPVGR